MKFRLLLLVFFLCAKVYGQNEMVLKPAVTKPFIEVTGTASREVVPDKIFMSITLTNKIIDKQQYNIELQEEKLRKVLEKNNIDLKLLSLSDASSEILTQKKKDVGYEVHKTFVLQLSAAEQVSKIARELQDLNIKETAITKLEHSKIDSLRKEVRIAAIKAAKDKAEYLLQAIGEQLDKPMEIKEVVDQPYYANYKSNNLSSLNTNENAGAAETPELEFEKIKISFSYFVKYAIK